jgi:hypothetical protein
MFGGIKVNENWRKRHMKELMQLFGDLDILSFVSISRLNWIGQINRKDSNRKVSQVFNNNPQGIRLRGRQKTRWWNCIQTDINSRKIKNWNGRSKNRADWEKSIKQVKVRIGLYCLLRRKRRRRRR